MTTIRDIASACGVAPQTVMSVIHNIPGKVSDGTRARILKAVREMDYRPGQPRRPIVGNKVNTIGLIAGVSAPSLMGGENYWTDVTRSVIIAAGHKKQNILLFVSELLHEQPMSGIRLYCDGKADGLIVIEPSKQSPLIEALLARGIPVVAMGHAGQYDHPLASVDVDNFQGMQDMVDVLIEAGHRRIAFAGLDEQHSAAAERMLGFRQAIRERGIEVPEEFIYLPKTTPPGDIGGWARQIMSGPCATRPTAIAAWDDFAAVQIIRAVRDIGLKVPEDVSVTGFDEDPFMAEYRVTTVRQPYDQIGQTAVDMLLSLIRREAKPGRILLPGEVVRRSTVAPAPSQG